jgi:hypothetical protein
VSILRCYVDDETMGILQRASAETGRSVGDLAEAAIAEAANVFKVERMRAQPSPNPKE